MLKEHSIPWEVVDYVKKDVIIPLLNPDILREYYEVISRNEFGFPLGIVEDMMSLFTSKGLYLNRMDSFEEFVDESDAVFYEITLTARSTMDAYLVTGNIKHFPTKKFVVTPREILDIIKQRNT